MARRSRNAAVAAHDDLRRAIGSITADEYARLRAQTLS